MDWERYEKLCQETLRKEYRAYREKIRDPFFVSSEDQAQKELKKMLLNVRQYMDSHHPATLREHSKKEHILTKYLRMGKKYGLKFGRKVGIIKK